jgi:pimeloyl-ACP methyl ester carboxylesterase
MQFKLPVQKTQAVSVKAMVVLLHGIGHSRWNMYWAERALRKAGYDVLNISYPSLRRTIDQLADFVQARLEAGQIWQSAEHVHFVTHSMGGLVTRRYLEKYRDAIPSGKLGRVVMLAPPHGGSEVADFLKDFPPYQWSFGPAGQELVTSVRTAQMAVPYYELGIIAGSKKWPYVVANFIIPGAHDGRVAVERTKLPGMRDHIVLPATHSFISWKPDVHRQIVYFLENGKFGDGA